MVRKIFISNILIHFIPINLGKTVSYIAKSTLNVDFLSTGYMEYYSINYDLQKIKFSHSGVMINH